MNWSNIILNLLIFILLLLIYNLPNHIYKTIEEKNTNKNNKQLQIESYFRQISGAKQEELLLTWSALATGGGKNPYENSPGQFFRKLYHDTLVYGSDETIKYLQIFDEMRHEDGDGWIVASAFIICGLKYDFTGYKISPELVLKIAFPKNEKREKDDSHKDDSHKDYTHYITYIKGVEEKYKKTYT